MSAFKKNPHTASSKGAAAGCILSGVVSSNRGIRLRVSQEHPRGEGGPLQGGFVILDVGDNLHSNELMPLAGRVTTSAEVLCIIRREHPGCVSITNAHALRPEKEEGR